MTDVINRMSAEEASAALYTCCHCKQWAEKVASMRPFADADALVAATRHVWWNETGVQGWLEAFLGHPRIGDVSQLREKFAASAEVCEGEQGAAMKSMNEEVLQCNLMTVGNRRDGPQKLAEGNQRYEDKFGHVFLICASGKPAWEILAQLERRYPSPPAVELTQAAVEQQKITELRLEKMVLGMGGEAGADGPGRGLGAVDRRAATIHAHVASGGLRSPITSHVLDIALGKPAAGIRIALLKLCPGSRGVWDPVSSGVTNSDGRVGTLLAPSNHVAPGVYRCTFDAGSYLRSTGQAQVPFYPEAAVDFEITPAMVNEHFHIPLLLSPFSYSTYRGS